MSVVYNENKSRILLVKILTRLGSLAFTVFWAFIWMIGMIWTFWTNAHNLCESICPCTPNTCSRHIFTDPGHLLH